MSETYDPAIAVWQRRRARDTFVSIEKSTDVDDGTKVAALLEALAALREAQHREFSALETRISDIETLLGKIASIPRKEVS